MQKLATIPVGLTVTTLVLWGSASSLAQMRMRFPDDGLRVAQVTAGSDTRATTVPSNTNTAPLGPVPATTTPSGQGATLHVPYDPYAPGGNPPVLGSSPIVTSPGAAMPSAVGGTTYPPGSYPPGSYPPDAFPSTTPPVLFPNGFPTQNIPVLRSWAEPFRFFQGPRFQHTWLVADNANDVGTNETDISGIFAVPNFLFLSQPLTISPGFSLYLLDGPTSPAGTASPDLPPRMYGAYMDGAWETDPNRIFGAEVATRVGIYTDFNTLNSDSLRFQGRGLIKYRFSPQVTLRGGIAYLDRLKIKMLPVGGILWEPNPRVRWDIYFPRPKLSQYLTTVGNSDVWWYVGAEYGGGSFTIKRRAGGTDRIDMNDIRLNVGFEWGTNDMLRRGRRTGFIEGGYVWDREVTFLGDPTDDFNPGDVFYIRTGLRY